MIQIPLFPNNNRLNENGYSFDEEVEIYDRQLEDLLQNPRWYLDHVEFLQEYRVSWKNYKDGNQVTLPHKFVRETQKQ